MTAILLNNRGFSPMSNEGDASAWTSIVNLGIGLGGIVVGLFVRGWTLAAGGAGRVATVEAEIRSLRADITALQARKDRVDNKLEDVPTRVEMQAGFTRLERQVEQLSALVIGRQIQTLP